VKTLVHIGVGKTGTTTLQRSLFARHRGVLSIGRPYANEAFKQAIESLRDDDEADYRNSALAEHCVKVTSGADGRVVVLSDETLVHPVHQSIIARRLHDVLPDAHILMTIRSQYDLIVSYWAAHGRSLKGVPKPYCGKIVGFDDWFAFEAEARKGLFARLDFYRLYQIYAEIFRRDRVHMMTYEQLASEPDLFASSLAALLGADENEMIELMAAPPTKTRPTAAKTRYKDLRSWLLPKVALSRLPAGPMLRHALHTFVDAGSPLRAVLTQSQRDAIRERFGSGNQALAATVGIDLSGLRYPLAADQAQLHRDMRFAAPAPGGRA
jgi:hypothetical protein